MIFQFKYVCVFSIVCLLSISLNGQSFSAQGKVKEKENAPAIGASVFFLNTTDSSLVKGTSTDIGGFYIIHNLQKGNYLLKISYLGYNDYYKKISLLENTDFGEVWLKQNTTILKEVEIKTTAVLATQNGDTTSFNSAAFKTNKDASAEELVSKMSGIAIQDGKIQAQGEDVKQVLVDGKAFFGDDAASVLKNLPAEIIDKVQVFDKKSDQSLFTGFDDGNTSKTINIVTKVQFRNGIFGKLYGGYGYEDKYKTGAVINRFKDKQRLTLLASSNNINEQNFSTEDLLGVVGASNSSNNRGGGSRGGNSNRNQGGAQNSADNFLVDIRNGITSTNAFGLNYSDSWDKNTNVSAAYFVNQTQNTAKSSLLRQFVVGNNNGQNYNEQSDALITNFNHRLNLKFDCKIDSQNSVLIQPKFSLQTNKGESNLFGINTRLNTTISDIDNEFKSDLRAYSVSFPILYRHSFSKKGRTVSFNTNPSYSKNGGNNQLNNYNSFYADSLTTDSLNQKSILNKSGFNSNTNVTYTEPLNTKSSLSLNYIAVYNFSESEKNTYNRNSGNTDYNLLDSTLSNVFNNYYLSNSIGSGYRYQNQKYTLSIGAAYQNAKLYKKQQFPDSFSDTRTFESILPNAYFQYRFTSKKNLRISYRAANSAPSIEQLQDVINNNNSLQLSIGNSNLKQNYQQNLSFRYSAVNTEKSTSLFAMLFGSYVNNHIGNSTIIANKDTLVYNSVFLAKGSQISRPVNLNNYYSARAFINYSFAIKKIKSNLNINSGCNYNHIPALINNETNFSNTTSPSLGLVLTSNINEKLDFSISSNTSYNIITNSLQTTLNSTFFNQNSKLKLTVTPVKWLVFQTEYNNQYFSGLSSGYNQSVSLWNAAIGFKFLKGQTGDLRLFVFDILNQNTSIQRNTTETYIEDVQTTILQRYFMLNFTWNFRKFFEQNQEKK